MNSQDCCDNHRPCGKKHFIKHVLSASIYVLKIPVGSTDFFKKNYNCKMWYLTEFLKGHKLNLSDMLILKRLYITVKRAKAGERLPVQGVQIDINS